MYEVKLDAFNGPLDLLLHLIQQFEIDIYDIPMNALTEQYMQYVHAMKQLDINVASEYLVMASELLMIKSQLLLPEHSSDEMVEEDPREALVGKLLEYQNYKAYAEMLNERREARSHYYTKTATDLSKYEVNERIPEGTHIDLTKLIVAYQKMKHRIALKKPRSVEIQKETFTIQQSTAHIFQQLDKQQKITFFDLFTFNESIEHVVTHFLALLEMAKTGVIQLQQIEAFHNIEITKGVNYGTQS